MIRRSLTALALVFLAASMQVAAQVPTAEQVELLRSMSPEDREALMEQMGISGDVLDDTGMAGGTTPRGRVPRDGVDPQDEADALEREAKALDLTFKPEDTVLIEIDFKKDKPARIESKGEGVPPVTIPGEPAPEIEPEQQVALQALIDVVRARNPYQLDSAGFLVLPGFPPIMLAGLDEKTATRRLAAENTLALLDVQVVRLKIHKSGIQALKPFGYDLFRKRQFAPSQLSDIPVPADYIVGPGDQLNIQLFGSQNRNLRLVVGRDGRISFPGLGPVVVGGRSFSQVSADIEERVSRQMIGVRASVGLGDARSIRVFVMGEVERPGSYTVSGLASITSALYASGGINDIGSLRDIQLKRQGAVVRRMDLYDLLLHGDTSDDAKLLPGDVIFIPPVAATIAVDGEVRRPAIYEIKGESSVAEAIRIAGGLTTEADRSRVALVRVNEQRVREVLDVSLDSAGSGQALRNGDALRVLRLRPTLDRGVTIEGHLFRPGVHAWREGMRLTDVIGSIDELRPNADINYILIRREIPPDRRLAAVSADLSAALRDPQSDKNILLRPRDRILVFDTESGRHRLLDPLLEEMRRQSRIDHPSEVVRIDGRVKARGEYPLEPKMRVSDLLRAGGGLQDAAYGAKAELIRYSTDGTSRKTDFIEIDLAAVLNGDASADVMLLPFDFLNIKEVPEWAEQEQVLLEGEVRFPGIYPIRRGETMRSVLARAGGLTSLAFPEGAVFTRTELLKREQEQIDRLADRLQSDLAAAALQSVAANQAAASQALSVGQSLLNQLKATKGVGRLVIDLGTVIQPEGGKSSDIVLRDGDHLMIPHFKQEVTVIGEVQYTTSHFYRDNLTRDDYIGLSGGTTRKADRDRIYVVRANGSVVSSENAGWFRSSAQLAMKPGDTVVVPLDTERMPALPLWQAVTQIIYNLAIAAAAVNSF
ncbi:MAG TPA: SLBB domain-containing protein [Steroidobacteraceae bacterium]|nr:SLBB domain-containing protein [Steroidobacteraceae bacterium]